MFRIRRKTRDRLIHGGVGTGSALGVAAGAAGILMFPVASVTLAAISLLAFATAGLGGFARVDLGKINRLSVRDATHEDLERLQTRLTEFAPHAAPLAERLKISRKNRGAFRVIEDLRDGGCVRRELGLLAIYPVTEDAADAIRAGAMRGSDIRTQHISKSFGRAAGLYVSFAEGSTPTARALVLNEIEESIRRSKRRPLLIATVPTTSDAVRVLVRRGFLTLNGSPPALNEVCVRDVRRNEL